MSAIKKNYEQISKEVPPNVKLVVVSKTHPIEKIQEVYDAGARDFGENKVQELLNKQPALPTDIKWHLIGHLQSNKVKYIAPFVSLVHSVDSLKLLKEINKQAQKNDRTIECLLQIYIAKEDTKFGLNFDEARSILMANDLKQLHSVKIVGLMGMATNTSNKSQIQSEFTALKRFFDDCRMYERENIQMQNLSMGMSSDYPEAIEAGSNVIRVGSSIFGNRK